MRIKKKFIRSIDRYISHLLPGNSIRIVVEAGVEHDLPSIGFSSSPTDGETVLPAVCGNVSKFNADGKYIVRKDLPISLRNTDISLLLNGLGNSGTDTVKLKLLPKKGTSAETVIQEILYHRHLRSSPGLNQMSRP